MQKADIAQFDDTVDPDITDVLRRDAQRHLNTGDIESQINRRLEKGMRVCYLSETPRVHFLND